MSELSDKLIKTQDNKATVGALMKSMEAQIARALPSHIKPDRMIRIMTTMMSSSPKIMQCDQKSLLAALMLSGQLGLEPNTPLGQCYIIPYGTKATFQLGYKGLIELAYRTSQYQVIYAMPVYSNDKFEFSYGLNPDLKHTPANKPEGNPVYYYAVYKLINGGSDFRVWSREKVETHAKKFSKAFNTSDSPWKTNFDSMAMKTVLIDVLKFSPKSIELDRAISNDGAIRDNVPEVDGNIIDIPLSKETYELQRETEPTANVEEMKSESKSQSEKMADKLKDKSIENTIDSNACRFDGCGVVVGDNVKNYSLEAIGEVYCIEHQKVMVDKKK